MTVSQCHIEAVEAEEGRGDFWPLAVYDAHPRLAGSTSGRVPGTYSWEEQARLGVRETERRGHCQPEDRHCSPEEGGNGGLLKTGPGEGGGFPRSGGRLFAVRPSVSKD